MACTWVDGCCAEWALRNSQIIAAAAALSADDDVYEMTSAPMRVSAQEAPHSADSTHSASREQVCPAAAAPAGNSMRTVVAVAVVGAVVAALFAFARSSKRL